MRAILLAAGYGTRLWPVTKSIPKCLVQIGCRPLLDIWINTLLAAGIERVLVNTHFLHKQVEQHISKSIWSDHIELTYESTLLGTCGTLLKNYEFYADQPVMLVHADNFSVFNVQNFIDRYFSMPVHGLMTMMTFNTDQPETCGIVEVCEDGLVTDMWEKPDMPKGCIANGAVYIISPGLVKFLMEQVPKPTDMSTEVIPKIKGKIFAFHNDVYHRDIGNIESLELARKDYQWLKTLYQL